MRLLSFEVTGLFERFDYIIELNQTDRITILHGPNGYGKTTVLQMLGHTLDARFASLADMPFRSMKLSFDTGPTLTFSVEDATERDESTTRRPQPRPRKRLRVQFGSETVIIKPLSQRSRERIAEMASQFAQGFERVGEDQWLDVRTGRLMSFETLLSLHSENLPPPFRDVLNHEEHAAVRQLRELLQKMHVFVIDTQRLIANRNLEMIEQAPRTRIWRNRVERREIETTLAAVTYSALLRDAIRDHLRRYGVKASELDKSLPFRILSSDISVVDTDALRTRYNNVLDRRQRLVKAGLLQEQAGGDITLPQTLHELQKQVFRFYLDDMETKLSVFGGFTERVQLFTEMINELFKYKQIEVGAEDGFRFRTEEGSILSAGDLSSGEQHQLVLLFDLLFRVDERSLILVDEPEISLHVEWQQCVLKNFQAISQLRDLDFLVATHSPDIIHDRWDLTIALAEQEHTHA